MEERLLEIAKYYIDHQKRNQQAFRCRYEHTLHVLGWCKRLMTALGGRPEILLPAAILHDIGYAPPRPHGQVSAELAAKHLPHFVERAKDQDEVLALIKNHSMKERAAKEMTLHEQILNDADLLDEIGAMGILWDAMHIAQKGMGTFHDAYYRARDYYQDFLAHRKYLKTDLGRQLFDERLAVQKNILEELAYELHLEE